MWTVTSDYVKGILTYFVEHKETGERKGSFDCEPWAKEFAEELNREEADSDTVTLEELKAEARKHGYRLQKIPDYDCSCYMPYPNIRHKHRNGKWKCVDRYEPSQHKPKYDCYHMPCTFCNRKTTDTTD